MVDSSPSGINTAQLVGTYNGTVLVPVYDRAPFLEQFFTRVLNIKKYHHFRFSKDEPGRVYFKESNSSPEESLLLLQNHAILSPASTLPAKLNPAGLSLEMQALSLPQNQAVP